MQLPLQISFKNLDPSDAIETRRGTYVLAYIGGFWSIAWVPAIKLPLLLF